jgi:hypothetical protein
MTTLMGRILQNMAARTGAGLFDELDNIDPCLVDEPVQAALPLEDDEIPLQDAVETCHRIAERMRMYE